MWMQLGAVAAVVAAVVEGEAAAAAAVTAAGVGVGVVAVAAAVVVAAAAVGGRPCYRRVDSAAIWGLRQFSRKTSRIFGWP